MSENKKYTIIVKKQRVEVSEAVYRAYHKEREAERYHLHCVFERCSKDGTMSGLCFDTIAPLTSNQVVIRRFRAACF